MTALRTNLTRNPVARTNLTDWSATTSAATPTLAMVTGTGPVGVADTWGRATTVDTPTYIDIRTGGSGVNLVSALATYTASAYMKLTSAVASTVSVYIQWWNGSGTLISTSQVDLGTLSTTAWSRWSITASAPVAATRATLIFRTRTVSGNYAVGDRLDVTGFLFEQSDTLGDYFDGTFLSGAYAYAWAGTADASVSTELQIISVVPYPFGEPLPFNELTVNYIAPGVEYISIRRIMKGRSFPVRGATKILAAGGATVRDYEAGWGEATYQMDQYDVSLSTLAMAGPTTETLDGPPAKFAWIHDPFNPETAVYVQLLVESAREISRPVSAEWTRVPGRSVGLVMPGTRRGVEGVVITILTQNQADGERLDKLLGDYDSDDLSIVCIRARAETWLPPTLYAFVQSVLRPLGTDGSAATFRIVADETAPPTPAIVVPLLTYDDFTTWYSSYTEFGNTYATYLLASRDYSIVGVGATPPANAPLNVFPTGIASAQAFGPPVLIDPVNTAVLTPGIISANAFGTVVVSNGRPTGANITPFESLPNPGFTLSARANQVTSGNHVSFLPGNFTFSDFVDASGTYGAFFPYTPVLGLRGSGVDSTIFSMVQNTSTKAGTIPAQSTGQTVQLSLMRAGGSGGTHPALVLSGFTIDATFQNHIYNGIILYQTTNGSFTDIKVTGVPGNASSQPGETFSFNDYIGTSNVYTRCTVLGENNAASGFAGNTSTSLTYTDCYATGCFYGHGWAFHIMHGTTTLTRCVSSGNGKQGFNFERCDGTIIMDRCDARGNGGYAIAVANDGVSNSGSVRLDIRDPVLDPGTKVIVRVTGFGSVSTTTQVLSQITVTVAGVNRPDLLQFA